MDETIQNNPQDNPLYKHNRDYYRHADISIRYHEFKDEYDVEEQIDNYRSGSPAMPGPLAFESYRYSLRVDTGLYLLNGDFETPSKKYRIAECGYYRPAFLEYYGQKEFDHALAAQDMAKLAANAGRMSVDLVLNSYFPDTKFQLVSADEYDPVGEVPEKEVVNTTMRFRFQKDADFNPIVDKKPSHIALRRMNLQTEMESLGGVITGNCIDKFAMHYADGNRLITVATRLL